MRRRIDPLLLDLLTLVSKNKSVSDLHLKAGARPIVRTLGKLKVLDSKFPVMTDNALRKMIFTVMSSEEKEEYAQNKQFDLGFGIPQLGRFRFNICQQRGTMRIVVRSIPRYIPSLEELKLPEVLKNICYFKRGLILVTGATGSGKSSTVASMLNHINKMKTQHIITLEDPIEYLISDHKSIVSQRELGIDMVSFQDGLKSALRQDPDVIFIGEIRDQEVARVALEAAETGHLVISTLHTINAQESISRIMGLFKEEDQGKIKEYLGSTLQAIVSQRLINGKEKSQMLPVTEVLLFTERVRRIVKDENLDSLHEAIQEGAEFYNMHSFDQRLFELIQEGTVDINEALQAASNPRDLRMKLKKDSPRFRNSSSPSQDESDLRNPLNKTMSSIQDGTIALDLDEDSPSDKKPKVS